MIAEPAGKKIDRVVVESKLRFLKGYLSDLAEYETVSLSDYRKSKKTSAL